MIEARLSKQNSLKTIVTLYANIITYFSAPTQGGGKSMHVAHIKSIEIMTNKKGEHGLLITAENGRPFVNGDEVDDKELDKVKVWVAEVQRAMQSTAL